MVTGGRSGLGEATAAMLEREGANVVVADLPETDVTDADAVQALVDSCSELHGAVNCAGIGGGARVVGFPLDRFRKIIEVNLIGTFNVLSLAAAKMAENEPDEEGTRGVVVNTASNAAFDGQIGQAAYSASKAGVAGMTLPVARDLASKGIRVVTIAPGPADTPMLGPMREDIRESLVSQIPFPKRLGRAEDFAALVKHIVENEYLNGEVIRLDGALQNRDPRSKGDEMAEYVKVEQDGRVAIVTLDHPPVNALSSKLLEELEEEYDRLDRDDETRAIVLRGEGEKAFVAGADITEFPAMREQIEEAAESGSARGIQKLAARMDAGRTPVVAAIHGYCLGGGLELAMACDIRIAADDAQLGQPEIKLGLIPGGGGTQRLPRLVGHGRALCSTSAATRSRARRPMTGGSSSGRCRAPS